MQWKKYSPRARPCSGRSTHLAPGHALEEVLTSRPAMQWKKYSPRARPCTGRSTHLAPGHAVKEVLLRSDAGEESAVDEAAGAGRGVVRRERGQRPAVEHERGSAPLQLNLPQEARDLHAVHLQTGRSPIPEYHSNIDSWHEPMSRCRDKTKRF